MKVLMFGWEFPPHISGGLGTASYGLTKGLSNFKDMDLLFVVPKAYGDEDQSVAKIVGAGEISFMQSRLEYEEVWEEHEKQLTKGFYEQQNRLKTSEEVRKYIADDGSISVPYLTKEQFNEVLIKNKLDPEKVAVNENGRLIFRESGKERILKFRNTEAIEKNEKGTYNFTGKYGKNLFEEVGKYAEVAHIVGQHYDFDLIHAHDWLTYAAGIAAKRASGKPMVIHVHATEFDRSGENVNQQVYDIERMGMHAADKIIAVSNLTRDRVIHRYGIDPAKVVTVYNAVEPRQAKDLNYTKSVNEKIVTFLGRITFQKGPEYFVEAAHKVLQKNKNVRFVMAGSGDLFKRMIHRAAQLNISSHFHFTGFLRGDDVDRMFALSDVYVMPSVSEPFGISPLEAMRSNVPVIISKQSGVSEILKHAIKTDFWDVDAIADSIYALLSYQGLTKMFGKHAKDEVNSLKWENAAAHVRKIYIETLKQFELFKENE